MNTHPENGARVRFELRATMDAGARYRVTYFTPDGAHECDAELRLADGSVTLSGVPEHAPEGLAKVVTPFAKQILSGRRADPEGAWPRRVLRWRAERATN
ncbi:MAG: hypothetical protein R3B40_10205 [Polyangiales bacterium]|nr:hypothetical protein [Myxococcales bacterium]MCB9657953.1 hypothetical protein [Sandaracinaceae bacterium]